MSSELAVYGLHGIALSSPWPLSAPRVASQPDFRVSDEGERDTTSEVPARELARGLRLGLTKAYADWPREGVATIRFENMAEFEVDLGRGQIAVWSHPKAERGFVPILLEGNVAAFIFGLRGNPVLHAAAVTFGGRGGLAIAGVAGQGKSTVAAMLCAEGARLLTDDTLRVDLSDSVKISSGTTSLRLRAQSEEVAAWFPDSERDLTVDGRIRIRTAGHSGELPLAAIIAPVPDRESGRVVVDVVRPAEAARMLLGAARFIGWADSQHLRNHLELVTRVAARVRTYRVRIPWGPPFERAVAHELAEALRQVENGG